MLSFKVFVGFSCLITIALAATAHITNGVEKLEGDDLKAAEDKLENLLEALDAGEEGPHYKLVEVHSGTTQIVAGTLTKLECELENEEGEIKKCNVSFWSQPWLENGNEVTFDCAGEEEFVSRL